MLWFGWIPILTEEVLLSKAIAKARKSAVAVPLANTYIIATEPYCAPQTSATPHELAGPFTLEVLATFREALQPPPGAEVFCYIRTFNDIDPSRTTYVAVSTGGTGTIAKVAMFSYPTPDPEIVVGIESISREGLVRFGFRGGRHQRLERVYANSVFGVVRDFYHEHIYATSTDFALRPVLAENEQAAVREIFRQYQEKIVDYHGDIKGGLSDLESHAGRRSPRGIAALARTVSWALGEMTYARSFAQLFSLPRPCLQSIDRASQSFRVLRVRVQSLVAQSSFGINAKLLVLTAMLLFFAVFPMLREPLGICCSVLVSLGIACIVFVLFPLIDWYVTKEKD